MDAQRVEQLLFDHAIKTRIRPPLSERVSNLAYNRVVCGGVVAGTALVCTLAMSNSGGPTDKLISGATFPPQIMHHGKRSAYEVSSAIDSQFDEPTTAGLVLSTAH
jgi:hypothetical protein